MLYCVEPLCTTHTYEQFVKLAVWVFFRLWLLLFIFAILFLCCFAFVVLGLVSSVLSQEVD